jgi:ATP-dependent DNA helicase RecG
VGRPDLSEQGQTCISNQITNTAIVLLGKNESEHFLSPAIARITWVLRDAGSLEKDYEHFGPPLILAVDQVFAKIRNLKHRYLPNASLFPTEIKQYDPWVVREILHNCIAHQDYTQAGRINMIEEPESLLFTNLGHFIPGSVEEIIRRDAPPEQYRNPFLAQAMVNLNMIDTIGSGIKRMFLKQRQRFFPMPDYDLSEPSRVKVQLFGKVLDENYTRMLIEQTDLDLMDVIALDKVQKQHSLTEEEFKRLKSHKLVEGRRPNLYVSARVATLTGEKTTYIRHRAFDKDHYTKMIISYLEKFGEAKREDIDELLLRKLSDALTDKQKKSFVTNLLQKMRKDGLIHSEGTTRWARWLLSSPIVKEKV